MLGWILFTLVWTPVVAAVSALVGIIWFYSMIAETNEKLAKDIIEACEDIKEKKHD